MPENDTRPVEAEVVEERTDLARPTVPTTINELASLDKERGVRIVEQRLQIFHTMRMASLQLLMPNDITLFKDRDGRETGFVGDQGCDRIKKLWGISIVNLGPMEKIEDADHPGDFAYRITGDGSCGLTGEAVFEMEGIRYSTEKYATEKPEGIQRTVAVQKAARANLDGGITRELAGLKSIPVEELDKAWEGSWKKSTMCNHGRGYGSATERAGGMSDRTGVAPQDIPICDVCVDKFSTPTKLVFRPGTDKYEAFWGCPNYKKHEKDKFAVKHSDLLKQIEDRQKATATREPGED